MDINEYIEKINKKTHSKEIKWFKIMTMKEKNVLLIKYVKENTYSEFNTSTGRYISYFDNYYIDLDKSYYSKIDDTYLYLFVLEKNLRYQSQFKNTEFFEEMLNMPTERYMLAVQNSIIDDIEELNNYDSNQESIKKIYNNCNLLSEKTLKFLESI